MRGLPLPREDLKNRRIEELKNPRNEDHKTNDRGFEPKCEDYSAKNEEFVKWNGHYMMAS